jgi:predicted transcriptional regulator
VPIGRSVQQDHVVCLEDGLKFRSMKRHLRTKYNLTPQDYRAKWGLPNDYPMVAPSYAQARSNLAKAIGFGSGGHKRVKTAKRVP